MDRRAASAQLLARALHAPWTAATSPAAAAAAQSGRPNATAACAALLPNATAAQATWRLELFVLAALNATADDTARALERAAVAAGDAGSGATEAFASTCVAAASAARGGAREDSVSKPEQLRILGGEAALTDGARALVGCVCPRSRLSPRALAPHAPPRPLAPRTAPARVSFATSETKQDESTTLYQVDGTEDQWTVAMSAECCFSQTNQDSASASPWEALTW